MKTRLPVRVYYEDTDAGGVVYYANYLRYAERGRTEFFKEAGFSNTQFLNSDTPVAFMVKRCEIDYLRPARLEDELVVETEVEEVGGASLKFLQTVRRGEETLVEMRVVVVCAALATGKPKRLPEELRERLAS